MNAKRVKYSPGKEEVVPVIQEQQHYLEHFDGQYIYPYTTGYDVDETETAVVTLRAQEALGGENEQAPGTLQRLGVGNSTVEVQGNGSLYIQQILSSSMHNDGYGEKEIEDDEEMEEHTNEEVASTVIESVQNKPLRPKTYYCPHCSNGFRTTGPFNMHMRACARQHTEVSADDRQCKKCGKVFSSVNYLKQHMYRHSGTQPFRCGHCCRKFFEESKYTAHMNWHKRQDQLREQARELANEHGGKQVVVKEYRCSFCTQNFTVVFDVGQEKRRYACDTCRDKYTNAEALRQPKQTAEKPRELVCVHCGRQFIFEGFLQRHLPKCNGDIKRPRN